MYNDIFLHFPKQADSPALHPVGMLSIRGKDSPPPSGPTLGSPDADEQLLQQLVLVMHNVEHMIAKVRLNTCYRSLWILGCYYTVCEFLFNLCRLKAYTMKSSLDSFPTPWWMSQLLKVVIKDFDIFQFQLSLWFVLKNTHSDYRNRKPQKCPCISSIVSDSFGITKNCGYLIKAMQ
jgi:hypothetical protein